MELKIADEIYPIIIERKPTTRNTYIRVKKDLTICATTNTFTSERAILDLINTNYPKVLKMIDIQKKKAKNNAGFNYLGKQYDIVYANYTDLSIGDNKVFMKKDFDIDKWYKKQAQFIFKRHLDEAYHNFNRTIPYPSLHIRKMSTRWGVCNIKTHVITLNLELIKRDPKYLDYVIVHELSHLVHADHSQAFWNLVYSNMPEARYLKKEMKEF